MVGGAARVTDIAVEYARTRMQFGGPIGRFQAVQHRCVDMFVETEAARSLAYAAACLFRDGDRRAGLAAAMAKAAASDAFVAVAGDGIQVHGGIGYTWEHDLHLYFRRAKSSELMLGDGDFHRERIATALASTGEEIDDAG
jgi:alkylation response protein AidB-like acyl-CoA dehydrogenase